MERESQGAMESSDSEAGRSAAVACERDEEDRPRDATAASPTRKRYVVAVAAAGLAFAVGGIALVLSASLRKPHQAAGELQHQIAMEGGRFAGASQDEEDVDHAAAIWSTEDELGELEDWDEIEAETRSSNDGADFSVVAQPPFDDEEGVELTFQDEPSYGYEDELSWEEDVEDEDEDVAESYDEGYDSEGGKEMALLEDCDNDSCFEGALSDFLIGNATALARTSRNGCKSNERRVDFTLVTDWNGWETSMRIVGRDNRKVYFSGPPAGRKFPSNQRLVGRVCLPEGRYHLEMKDLFGDGLCCTKGRGKAKVMIAGRTVAQTGSENFRMRKYPFQVSKISTPTPGGGAGGGGGGNSGGTNLNNSPINSGKECSVVKPINFNNKFKKGSGYEGFPGLQCYRTVAGTKKAVNDLVAKYPNLAQKVDLGFPTYEKKERLYAIAITNKQKGGQKGKMLMLSSIHSREIATSEVATQFAEFLLQNYSKDAEVKWILDHNEVHIIPHGNPDGRIYIEKEGGERMWKKNRNNSEKCDHWRYGVDPNRNFPFKWGQCKSDATQKCEASDNCQSTVYRGPRPNSEQETKAILQYASKIFPASQRKGNLQQSEQRWQARFPNSNRHVFFDVHSFGEDVIWPWGFVNQRTPNDDSLGALGRKLASFNKYSLWAPKMKNRKYGLDGGTFDTTYGYHGVPSFALEVGTSFYPPCSELPNMINQVFPALMYGAKVARESMTAPKGPDVLCTTITSTRRNNVKFMNVKVQVSDSVRMQHADDDGAMFPSGRQSLKSVDIYVNCHPYASNCRLTVRKVLPNGTGRTATVQLEFRAPTGRSNNVMYIRATDSSRTTGPISARSFSA